MAKKKYKFNPDTLSYESVGLTWKSKLGKIATYLSSSLALALIMVVVFLQFYETPKSKATSSTKVSVAWTTIRSTLPCPPWKTSASRIEPSASSPTWRT